MRASQEEFCKENLQLTPSDCAEEEEHTGRGKDCKTQGSNVNLEIANDDKHHEFECNLDGICGFAEKNGDTMCIEDSINQKIQLSPLEMRMGILVAKRHGPQTCFESLLWACCRGPQNLLEIAGFYSIFICITFKISMPTLQHRA